MNRRTPSYCLHKATGQAVVRIDGKDHYLGKHGSPESRAEYNRLISQWYANANSLPPSPSAGLTITELLLRYWGWAEEHYRDDEGNPSREPENIKYALRPLRKLHGHTLARDFGPLALRAVQQEMVKDGLARTVVNARINRIRRVFKWAASFELIPVSVYEALRTVAGLPRGRGKVRETKPIRPVAEEHLEATLPFLPVPVKAIAQLQKLTGCRSGEAMVMRAVDLNMTGPVWVYRPRAGHQSQ